MSLLIMKKTDYRAELSRFDIHMKDGREKFLNEVAKYWEAMYPVKADWFKTQMRHARDVTVEGATYAAGKGREFCVKIRVPTELWQFIKRWIPDFGEDSKDIDLLLRVWCDLVRPARDHRTRTRLFLGSAACPSAAKCKDPETAN